MTLSDFLSILADSPLIASVQASEGSPLEDPDSLLDLALASLSQGVRVLRLEGIANIGRIRAATNAPVIGLIKRTYLDSDVYITPTASEIDTLIETGCEIVTLDATLRRRPGGAVFRDLVSRIHRAGRLAMADCDSLNAAVEAIDAGADIVSTTLAGYTEKPGPPGPDLDLLARMAQLPKRVLIAEGRYSESWHVRAAMRLGAAGVVVGGALNDPVKQTRRFATAAQARASSVGAVDIGGTWLRAGIVTPDGRVLDHQRIPLAPTRDERNAWINAWIQEHGIREVGIGAGGIIHPTTGEVLFAKPIIPDHVGTVFPEAIHAERVNALNDGHATAWAHAMHPQFAGRRVATLALGTGVGFGLVDRGQILMGSNGEHPRINDTPTRSGRIFDDLLGGAAITATPSDAQMRDANESAEEAVRLINTLYYPDVIVIAGGVGLQPWLNRDRMRQAATTADVQWSPYGSDAGLIGAGYLALFPIET